MHICFACDQVQPFPDECHSWFIEGATKCFVMTMCSSRYGGSENGGTVPFLHQALSTSIMTEQRPWSEIHKLDFPKCKVNIMNHHLTDRYDRYYNCLLHQTYQLKKKQTRNLSAWLIIRPSTGRGHHPNPGASTSDLGPVKGQRLDDKWEHVENEMFLTWSHIRVYKFMHNIVSYLKIFIFWHHFVSRWQWIIRHRARVHLEPERPAPSWRSWQCCWLPRRSGNAQTLMIYTLGKFKCGTREICK